MPSLLNAASRYANWLHLQWPSGLVERLPEAGPQGQTAVRGLYIAGDLTGIPLLKFSADGAVRSIRHIQQSPSFSPSTNSEIPDLIIIGAGVAGMAAALEAKKLGLSYTVLEASEPFSTLINFPKGKPIYTYPMEMKPEGDLQFSAEVRETLLEEVRRQSDQIHVKVGRASHVETVGDLLHVKLGDGNHLKCKNVLVAIGRSGEYRKLGVPGEELEHVKNRLHDPKTYKDQRVLVVGGGDSALEAAIALVNAGAKVSLSYRKKSLTRPKAENVEAIETLNRTSKNLSLNLGTQVQKITESHFQLKTDEGLVTSRADAVLTLIGREAPLSFFRKSKVPIVGEWTRKSMIACGLFIVFCFALYNWKSGGFLADLGNQRGFFPSTISQGINDVEKLPKGMQLAEDPQALGKRKPWAYLQPIPSGPIEAAAAAQSRLDAGDYVTNWDEKGHLERQVVAGQTHDIVDSTIPLRSPASSWFPGTSEDRTSFIGAIVLSAASPSFWYTLAYVLLVSAFGLKRIRRHKTGYITVQTASLMLIQAIPLFLLPEIILPLLGYHGLLPSSLADSLFPAVGYGHGREYWRAYGFILAWPLSIYNWQTAQPLWGWIGIGAFQTFVLVPFLVWKYGKGAYCGWICSCGALAETLGDEFRTKMPHGPKWNRLNILGQVILGIAALMMLLRIGTWIFPNQSWLRTVVNIAKDGYGAEGSLAYVFTWLNYKWFVDVFLAGILGYGLYFWMSGRTWCRFACPMAALMHIYARFSKFRIFADKKKCISCNVCTSVCHQGIDIMNFANKGAPMTDPECVRCSACVNACPTGTLVFGEVDKHGSVAAIDSLIASPVHQQQGKPKLSDLGGDL